MPTSEKQINANRENAKKSTGPKTPEGKQRAALNGARHHLTGATYIMSDEDRKAFDKFSGPFIASLSPANEVQHSYAHLVAVAHWRLNRIHAIEENTFSLGHFTKASDIEAEHPEVHHALTQARVFDLKSDMFKNLSIYEQRIAREMNKNLKTLFELQDRALRGARTPACRVETPLHASLNASQSATAGSDVRSASLIATELTAKTGLNSSNGFGFADNHSTPPDAENSPFIAKESLQPDSPGVKKAA